MSQFATSSSSSNDSLSSSYASDFPLLSRRDAAKYLGICLRSLDQLIHDQQLPIIRIGRRVMFRREALHQWLQARERNPHRRGRP